MEKEEMEIELKLKKDLDEKEMVVISLSENDNDDPLPIKREDLLPINREDLSTEIEKIDRESSELFYFNKTALVSYSMLSLIVFMNLMVFNDDESDCKLQWQKALSLAVSICGIIVFLPDIVTNLEKGSKIRNIKIESSREQENILDENKRKEISEKLQGLYSPGINYVGILIRLFYFFPLAIVYGISTGSAGDHCELNWEQVLLRISPLLLVPIFGFIHFAKDRKIDRRISDLKNLIDNNKNNEKGEHA